MGNVNDTVSILTSVFYNGNHSTLTCNGHCTHVKGEQTAVYLPAGINSFTIMYKAMYLPNAEQRYRITGYVHVLTFLQSH